MKEFFESQIFALILGASLTLITSIISDKRTYSNSLDEKIKMDPAVMASPLITTIVDAGSLMIYFKIACILLNI